MELVLVLLDPLTVNPEMSMADSQMRLRFRQYGHSRNM